MGQITRTNRAERFIEEFEKDYVGKFEVKANDKLKVKRVFLACIDGDYEFVRVVVVLTIPGGKELVLLSEDILFDPEDDGKDDSIERLTANLGITKKEAAARLKKADLFDRE
jgi:hypothetical protein